ncbi:hypothetical protein AAF712_006609 [Marasmius tenuissimus]|uniref:Ricin B lectin domain-containing protein n=1 Tax=Marasmius tenuissimus TaxID=585030 RepID=A0ABR2ZYK4_9AGAR
MRSTATFALRLLAFVAVSTAVQIQSSNPGFQAAGRRGCITAQNSAGAAAVVQDCNGSNEQNWVYSVGSSAAQQLKVNGDKCLDVQNGRNADGTKLQVWTCTNGNTNQLWTPNGDGTFQWAGTNKCVDLTGGNVANQNQLQIWTCDSNNVNQRWLGNSVTPPPDPPAANTKIYSSVFPPHQAVKVIAASTNANGAAVLLDDYDARSNSLPQGNRTWVMPAVGTTGQIKTFDGTMCLDVKNGDTTNGNTLQVWACSPGNPNQLWKIESLGEDRKYFVRWGGKCMQVKDGNLVNKGQVGIWDCNSTDMYQWWYEGQ